MIQICLALALALDERVQPRIGVMDSQFGGALVPHAADFDVSVVEVEKMLPESHRTATMGDGKQLPATVWIARCKTLDSTRRPPGAIMDVVWIPRFWAGFSQTPPNLPRRQRYFVITYPPAGGTLAEVHDSGVQYPLGTTFTVPLGGAQEEMCCVALLTSAKRLEYGQTPAQTLMWSAADTLRLRDKYNRTHAFNLLDSAGYPDVRPAPTDGSVQYPPPTDNVVTTALRAEAKLAPGDLSVTLYELLALWGLKLGGIPPFYESYARCARDADASVPTRRWPWTSEEAARLPDGRAVDPPDYTVRTLDRAVNLQVVKFFLARASDNFTREQDKHLVVWLDSADWDIRYATACHFARSQNRPDLKPQAPDRRNGEAMHPPPLNVVYPGLEGIVASWKEFFQDR